MNEQPVSIKQAEPSGIPAPVSMSRVDCERDPFAGPAAPAPAPPESSEPERESSDEPLPALTPPADPLAELQALAANMPLLATLTGRGQRMAVIAGKTYREGMHLDGAPHDVVISSIAFDHVVIRKGNEQAMIRYEDVCKEKKARNESPAN